MKNGGAQLSSGGNGGPWIGFRAMCVCVRLG